MRGANLVVGVLLLTVILPAGPAGAPVAAQEANTGSSANLVVDDPVGDQAPAAMLPFVNDDPTEVPVPPNPALAAYEQIDITRFEVGNDDSVTFQFIIDVVGFDGAAATATQAAALTDATCILKWTYVDDDPDLESTYRIRFSTQMGHVPGTDPTISRPNWYWDYRSSDGGRGYSYGGWPGADIEYDGEEGRFVVTIYKSFVPVWPGGHDPATGDTLVPLLVGCGTDPVGLGAVHVWDSVAFTESDTYGFQSPNAGDVIHVRYADQDEPDTEATGDAREWNPPRMRETMPTSTAAPGTPTVIPVIVSNNADGRKLVQLRAQFEGDAPEAWNVTLTPSVMIPGTSTRTVNLIVTAPASAATHVEHTIRVTAEATGESHAGAASRVLRVGPVLGADSNTFHIHARTTPPSDPVSGVIFTPRMEVTASLLETLEAYDDEPVILPVIGSLSDGDELDPLARSVRLSDDPVQVAVGFNGDAGTPIRVRMTLADDQGQLLFHLDQEVPGDGVTELSVPMAADAPEELEAGRGMYFSLTLGRANQGQNADDVGFDPTGSWFALPVVKSQQVVSVTDGRFLPSLSLAEGEDSTTYVNPGKAYAYDLVLANDGIETDDLALRVAATNATGWDIEVLPGAKFRVSPGNATPVSVVVRAPETAAEGDRANFEVVAQSSHDAAVRTRLDLDAIVTTGVDLDEKDYTAKEGEIDPLVEERGATPGPSAWIAGLLIAALAMAVRRRR